MAEIKWTEQAAEDLQLIADGIAHDSVSYARMFVTDVLTAVVRIGLFPDSGRQVPEVGQEDIREVILGNYRIIYRTAADTVVILTVYHGARLLNPTDLH